MRVAGLTDIYEKAAVLADALEAKLQELELWPTTPRPEPLVIKSAFGCKEIPFERWLEWVLLPRLREIVADHGEFPNGSNIATYAGRALSGCPRESEVHEILYALDKIVNEATGD